MSTGARGPLPLAAAAAALPGPGYTVARAEFLAIGLDHTTAGIALRERLAVRAR